MEWKKLNDPPQNQLCKSNARRAKHSIKVGQCREAIQVLSSGGLAHITPEVLNKILAKHPQGPSPPNSTEPTSAPPPTVSQTDIHQGPSRVTLPQAHRALEL